jgi:hypothetical protein
MFVLWSKQIAMSLCQKSLCTVMIQIIGIPTIKEHTSQLIILNTVNHGFKQHKPLIDIVSVAKISEESFSVYTQTSQSRWTAT